MRTLLRATTCLGLLLLAIPAWAGGFHCPDFGSRRVGMNAVVAKPDDPTAIFHNAAGMTLLDGTVVYASQTLSLVNLGFRVYDTKGVLHPDHEITPTQYWGVLPFFAAVTDLGTKRWRLGLGLYSPNFYGAYLPEDEPTRYYLTQGFFVAAHATLSAAYMVSDKLSVGLGLSLVYIRLQGKQIMNPLVMQDPDLRFSTDPGYRDMDIEASQKGQDFTFDWNAGLLFRPLPELNLGLSFISGAPVDMSGTITLKPKDGPPQTTGQHTTMVIPFTLRAGFNWEFAPGFEVAAEAAWFHYQNFQQQVTTLDKPLLGIESLRNPKNYGNSWAIYAGLLHKVIDDVDVMIGTQRDFSPTPSSTITIDNLTRDLLAISGGARWRVTPHWTVGAAFIRSYYAVMDIQDNVGSPPMNGKGHGDIFEINADVMYRF